MAKLKGVHVPHRKNTEDSATQVMPVPDKVYISMAQHMGPPCEAKVQVGDLVKVGQVVGDSDAFLSAPVHSSVSGKVVGFEEIQGPNGSFTKNIVIETDKLQEMHEDVKPPVVTDLPSFVAAVKNCGLVGLGGAGFPAHIKFNPKNIDEVDSLVINAAECEPYITSDYRTIMENAEDALDGMRAIMKYLNIKNCYIGVEDNKPKGIEKLKGMVTEGMQVVSLNSTYPKGAEKMLILETTGRVCMEGKLPADVGVIVANITTCAKLGKYLKDGIPLTTKRLTVDGGAIAEPKNVEVVIGTLVKEIVDFCGGYKVEPRKILMGGPMMGFAQRDDAVPVVKNNNAILAFDESQVADFEETDCIRCGRCVRACPMNLMPLRIEDCFNRNDIEGLKEYKVMLCIECGCCTFSCPAKRHLVQVHRLAKARLRRS